jgi:hypothetical protein
MLNLLSLTVVLPLLGAGGIFVASFLFTRLDIERGRFWTFVAALVVAVATFVSVLVLRGRGSSASLSLPPSRSALLTESVVRFHLDATLWPLAAAFSLVTCSFLLAEFARAAEFARTAGFARAAGSARRSDSSLDLTALALVLLALGLAALWSATPLATIVSWALYDLFLLLGQISVDGWNGESVRTLALGSFAGLFLWGGVLVAGDGMGSVPWSLMPPGGIKMTFWMLAGLLRIGAYPFHLAMPDGRHSSLPIVTMVFLSPVVGWGLWGRLALVTDGSLPVRSWMVIPALLTLVSGGFLAWTAKSSRDAHPWIGMGANGALLLSSVVASLPGGGSGTPENAALSILSLGGTSWVLGVTILFLDGSLAFPKVLSSRASSLIPSLVGALSLIGAPITLGFVTESCLVGPLVRRGHWIWSVGFVVGQAFLVAAVVRWLLSLFQSGSLIQPGKPEGTSLGQLLPAAGWIGSALFLIIGGLAPSLLLSGSFGLSLWDLFAKTSLVGWLLWFGSLLLGSILAWQDLHLRPKISLWLDALHNVVRLNWAWNLLLDALNRGLSVVRIVDETLGGRGALLWSFILFLILVLAWRAS